VNWKESQILAAARMMATDDELCRMFQMTPKMLERYRATIEQGKAEGLLALRFERAKEVARRGKGKSQ